MDFAYTPAQQELKARAAAYAELLMGYEDEAERAGGPLPKETVDKLTRAAMDAGMYGINMPAEWGGAGLSLLEQVIVEEEFGKVTNCLWDIPWRPANVLALASPEQRERYLLPILRGERFDAFATTEPDAGSDAGAIATTAAPVDGGWLINGEKWFVTCGDVADFLLVQANVLPGNENTLFFVEKDTPGVRISRTPHFMHSAVNGHPEFVFENVFVPTDAVLGEVGQGFELTKDWFTDERLMIAARTVGVAERALRLARDWAIQRKQFGVPISDFQMIQAMLADCAVDIAVNRSFTHQVAWEADNGVDRKTLARQGLHREAVGQRGRRPGRRPLPADLRRPGLRPGVSHRADVPRGAGRPHLGRHLGDPAGHRRQRADQARHGVPRPAGRIDEPGTALRRPSRDRRPCHRRRHRHRAGRRAGHGPLRCGRGDLRTAPGTAGEDRRGDRGAGLAGTRRAHRHPGRRCGAPPGRPRYGAVRPDRHPGQQRGRAVLRSGRADQRQGLACSAPPGRRRDVVGHPRGRGAHDDPATVGRDLLHGVLTAPRYRLDGARKFGTGCTGEPGRGTVSGVEPVRHPDHLHCARHHRYRWTGAELSRRDAGPVGVIDTARPLRHRGRGLGSDHLPRLVRGQLRHRHHHRHRRRRRRLGQRIPGTAS